MRYRLIIVIVLPVIIVVLIWLSVLLEPKSARAVQVQVLPAPLSTTTANTSPPTSTADGFDSTIIAALIGLLGILISVSVSLYLFRRTRQLEREKILLQDKVAATRVVKNREQLDKETEAEIIHATLQRANNLKAWFK